MTSKLTLLAPGSAWQNVVRRLHGPTVCCSDDWLVAASALEAGSRPELAVLESDAGTVAFPYLVRSVQGSEGLFDLVSAYEFGGLWFSTDDPARQQALHLALDESFFAAANARHYVSAFVRVNPCNPFAVHPAARHFQPVLHQQHVWADLRQGYPSLAAGYKACFRKNLANALRSGLWIDDRVSTAQFVDLYHANMRRLQAADYYFFPVSFFDCVRDRLYLFAVREPSGELAAIHAYLLDPPVVYAFLCMGVTEKNALRPNNFAYDHLLRTACQRQDLTIFHAGGGHASLQAFKQTISRAQLPASHIKAIFSADRYLLLSREKGTIESRYFPAYRSQQTQQQSTHGHTADGHPLAQ